MYQSGNVHGGGGSGGASGRRGWGEITHTAVAILWQWGVAKPIRKILVGCYICLASQKLVCHVSHEKGLIGHLRQSFSMLGDRDGGTPLTSGVKGFVAR